ncbi:sigma-70 family RNA polymerase sigma factor [Maribacter halichondriae]|uniref:sigma-70 family RNA polymerase sigma factor n=1 Tax=Maribacter halichondriae TaxID=2980554 RepID=UPI0023588880|nr:sigma-70 family RNA polymerase sigma factor [Maribacter sp. Hal144]
MEQSKNNHFVAHVFRHEYGKIISYLVHKFAPSYLEKIEDAVQESLIKAMQVWGYKGPPKNPTAWLLRVANNQLIDSLRRDKKIIFDENDRSLEKEKTMPDEIELDYTINDSQLKMIFACCHPSLSKEYQIILSLKLIGGFGNKEIARAMLKKEEAVAKSFTRAKKD